MCVHGHRFVHVCLHLGVKKGTDKGMKGIEKRTSDVKCHPRMKLMYTMLAKVAETYTYKMIPYYFHTVWSQHQREVIFY